MWNICSGGVECLKEGSMRVESVGHLFRRCGMSKGGV